MPTYVYRTFPPEGSGVPPREFEVTQGINDPPLTLEPETGFPVKRIVTAGTFHVARRKGGGGCCGGGCGCH